MLVQSFHNKNVILWALLRRLNALCGVSKCSFLGVSPSDSNTVDRRTLGGVLVQVNCRLSVWMTDWGCFQKPTGNYHNPDCPARKPLWFRGSSSAGRKVCGPGCRQIRGSDVSVNRLPWQYSLTYDVLILKQASSNTHVEESRQHRRQVLSHMTQAKTSVRVKSSKVGEHFTINNLKKKCDQCHIYAKST